MVTRRPDTTGPTVRAVVFQTLAIEHLSDVLRMTLARLQDSMGTLADEAHYVRAYLAVEQQRLGDRLAVEWDIATEAQGALLPPLIIQPLVENAIKHAIGAIAAKVAISRLPRMSRRPGFACRSPTTEMDSRSAIERAGWRLSHRPIAGVPAALLAQIEAASDRRVPAGARACSLDMRPAIVRWRSAT